MTVQQLTPVQLNQDKVIWVSIPEGYARVWSGSARVGDKFLNAYEAQSGQTRWEEIILSTGWLVQMTAPWFLCLIRRSEYEIGEPCMRCGIMPTMGDGVMSGLCWTCAFQV